MAVERLSITSSRIITRDSNNTTTFDTERRYLKSDSSGQLLAGGYTRAPIVAGSSGSELYDHTGAGGFIVSRGTCIMTPTANTVPATMSFSAPAFDNLTLDQQTWFDSKQLSWWNDGPITSFTGNGRNIGTYRWSIYYWQYTTGTEINNTENAWVLLVNYLTLSEAFEGGTLEFPYYGAPGVFTDVNFDSMFMPAISCTKSPNNLALTVTP